MRKSKLRVFIAAISLSLAKASVIFAADTPPTPPSPPIPAAITPAPPAPAAPTPAPIPVPNLVWDSEMKEMSATNGQGAAEFTFYLTNLAPVEVVVNNVQTSCGCTVAKLPEQPWHVAPNASGHISVTVNLAGKMGTFTKQITANTSVGMKQVQVKITMPPPAPVVMEKMSEADRLRNQQLANANRQAVFQGDCIRCHYTPAQGKMGGDLYKAVCEVCHESPNRAAQVPDLHALKFPTNLDYWRHWIRNGRPGSMMPAFDSEQGGPLIPAQVTSLAEYLEKTITHAPPAPAPASTNAGISPIIPIKALAVPPAK
jgi:mono/diheme cytochrome c family protein